MAVPSHAPAHIDPGLAVLYEQLWPSLVRFAEGIVGNRADAEEAVQDAFLAASRAGPIDEPRPWLYRVTRNAAVDVLRRRRRLVPYDPDALPAIEAADASPHARAEQSDQLRVLRAGIDRLPDQQRSSLLLRELAGLGYREIASVLDVSEANVKVLIFRARRSLDEFGQAVRLPCESAQLTLSARADGEAGRGESARARLHATTCSRCRPFAGAIAGQRSAMAMLVPALPVGHGVAAAALHAAGAKAGGGLGGLFGLKAVAATVATVAVVSTGAVVAEQEGIVLQHTHPPRIHVVRSPFTPTQQHQHRTGEDGGGESELRGRAAEGETEGGGSGGGEDSSGSGGGDSGSGSSDSGSGGGSGDGSGSGGSGTSGSGELSHDTSGSGGSGGGSGGSGGGSDGSGGGSGTSGAEG